MTTPAPNNPYAKTGEKRKIIPKKPTKARCGPAQVSFIRDARRGIDEQGSLFFAAREWSNICFGFSRHSSLVQPKKMSPEHFYCKPIAAWVPHLIIPSFVPTCPKCHSKESVDVSKTRWVENPKLLYGIFTHKYLDTVYYHCVKCQKDFLGWHMDSIKLDADEIAGILNYRLSKGFAVDEALYSFIVTNNSDTTASIHQRLKKMAADNWMNDATCCCRAVLAERVKTASNNNKLYVSGTNQRTLDNVLIDTSKITPEEKKARSLRHKLATLERDLKFKEEEAERDVLFVSVFQKKRNRNKFGLPFKGIGRKKLLLMIDLGMCTAKELLEHDGTNPAVLDSWKDIVQAHYDNLCTEVVILRRKRDEAEVELEDELALQSIFGDHALNNNQNQNDIAPTVQEPPPRKAPPRLTDRLKHNVRTVSKATIDRIKSTDSRRRMAMQDAKMRSIPATVLKIDFNYKLAPKIKVHNGRGKPFSPYKTICCIHNEDSLTVFWKLCAGSEGINLIKPDLEKIKKRQELLGNTVIGLYVDNCCGVRPKLAQMFPGAFVLLDCFHWQQRWDGAMYDVKSEKTTIFRSLMRRALFVTEDTEYRRVRDLLLSQNKSATPREVLKQAKATMPPPDLLERRVMAVIHSLMEKDLEVDKIRTTDPNNKEPRFFKRGADTLNLINNQLEHVRNGCLSDPSDKVVQLHRHNERTRKTHSARGTSSIEVEWRHLHRILDAPSIGLSRAVTDINNFYEDMNDRKRVNRLGEEAEETSRTEQLQALHAMASSCGFSTDEIGFKKPSFPRVLDEVKEFMGFDYKLPQNFNIDDVNDEALDDNSDEEREEELADFLRDINFVDENSDGEASFIENFDVDHTGEEVDNELEPVDVFCMDVEVDCSLCVPELIQHETTCESFLRLTQQQPWMPFRNPKEASLFNDTDKAEHKLFDEMKESYNRNCKRLDAPKGYKTFAKSWNSQVSNLFKAQLDGQEVTLVKRKTCRQLQDHYDTMVKHDELKRLSEKNDPLMASMEAVFKQTRRQMLPHQSAATCRPINYNNNLGTNTFGVPFALNPEVSVNAFQHNAARTGIKFKNHVPKAMPTLTRAVLGPRFKANAFCSKCGYRKKKHNQLGVAFGDNCVNNCLHQQCSKCWIRTEEHVTGYVGPFCTTTTSNKSDCEQWWKPDNQTGII